MSAQYAWWDSLRHGGLLIAPSKLAEFFPSDALRVPDRLAERLRRDLSQLEGGAPDAERRLLATVLEQIAGLDANAESRWARGPDVGTEWARRTLTGEAVRPRAMWFAPNDSVLPVFVDRHVARLGVGRGRRSVSRVLEWLRGGEQRLALLTNLKQWRLVYAGLDFDAWAEWDTDLWFEEGGPGAQITALQILLSPQALTSPREGEPSPLLAAIQATRRGQAELSSELGERVRRAVELLTREHGQALARLVDEGQIGARDIYIAATRIVMRMVVVLFAEARDLLPRDNPIYHGSYGLQGLREGLERVGGGAGAPRLRHRAGAWPRVIGLFRLVHQGSHHAALGIPRYGGELFAPGDPGHDDPIRRALAVFEDPEHAPNDAVVYRVLGLLCRSRVKVRQGRASTWVEAPVDFSDLSSEYIGILYEGLLDFELRRAGADDPMVFLALGNEPVLPLSRLAAMSDRELKGITEKLKQAGGSEPDEEAEAIGEEDAGEVQEQEGDLSTTGAEAEEAEDEADAVHEDAGALSEEAADVHHAARERAVAWARRAVEAGGLVRKPRSKKETALREYEERRDQTADRLIKRVVVPGEWFLVRWGGTRKGSGTFYTRPQLAVPTAQRTLQPLALDPPRGKDGQPDEKAPAAHWTPRSPEAILALKVCDPAMGSGSFLVAALRYLTDALYRSLFLHDRIQREGEHTLVTVLEGEAPEGALAEERLPAHPEDAEFEERLRARLKRHVVERCIYGVDFDPLAVELARLALWVETMDRDLPFEFLDHKLKVGNSLVGCWFDRFHDYPALAWEREGGDKTHSNGVHFKKEGWTKGIKKVRNEHIKPELEEWIAGQRTLFEQVEGRSPETVHDEAAAALEAMHAIPVHDAERRAEHYRDHIERNTAIQALRQAMNTWCAVWFWPPNELAHVPTPRNVDRLSGESLEIVGELARQHRFFHWEIEFPDVFTGPQSGFHAMLGNPPWDIQKPNSREYFSNIDPLYRTYGKQEALGRQSALFEAHRDQEREWLEYNAHFKALSNWCKHAGSPFGDGADGGARFSIARGKAGEQAHARWQQARARRSGYADPEHPFRHQGGGDINSYKLFLETAHALLAPGGQLGMIAPSGIYTDKGTTELRNLFVSHCRWRWLFGFENREKIFPIDSRFKFGPLIVEKGGETEEILTAFMHRDLVDWERAERHVIPYPRPQIEKFSPKTRAILEIRAKRDLEILDKIYSNSVLLGDDGSDGWGIKYATEFHMTNDSHLFKPRPWWEARGYKPDEYGRWIGPSRDAALPVYEGRMIGQFDFSKKGWVSGKGRGAVWRDLSPGRKGLEPQYLMAEENYAKNGAPIPAKTLMMDVTSSSNTRTVITSVTPDFPSGHKTPVLTDRDTPPAQCLLLSSVLNSFVYDFAVRSRLGGNSLIWAVLEETPLPSIDSLVARKLLLLAARLSLVSEVFAAAWEHLRGTLSYEVERFKWRQLWAVTPHERLRIRAMLDALVFSAFGLDAVNVEMVLDDCDHAVGLVPQQVAPKGFWRIDKEKDPELRHTVLTLVAFNDLGSRIQECDKDKRRGIEAFCNQNDGEGWMLPETLCLADLGLGHDERAKHPQPVRQQLGPRFYDWQLQQSSEESWAECRRHARAILGEKAFRQLTENEGNEVSKADRAYPEGQQSLFPDTQRDMFQD